MEKISKTPYEINKEFISNMDDDLFIQEYFSIMERCSDSPDLRSYVEYSINEYTKDNSSYSFSLKLNGDRKEMTDLEYELLSCLYDIQQMCIGEIVMNYKLDAEYIGRMISETTGMNVRELEENLKQHEQIKI